LALSQAEAIAPFQEAIRADYPLLRQEREMGIVISSEGVKSTEGAAGVVWRFANRDGSWHVSLAPTFLAMDTVRYQDRADFVARFSRILAALEATIHPVVFDRLGLRYVDRIELDGTLGQLRNWIAPELLGVLLLEIPPGVTLKHTVSNALFATQESQLQARWGYLPPNATLDASVEPALRPSWVLDIDVYQAGNRDFEVGTVIATLEQFARTQYAFFRWAVTDEFLRHCGGQVA
jgi:uncharacterized protein (TIGR04255 family)